MPHMVLVPLTNDRHVGLSPRPPCRRSPSRYPRRPADTRGTVAFPEMHSDPLELGRARASRADARTREPLSGSTRRPAQAVRPPAQPPAAHPAGGARARAPQGPRRRGREAAADRVEPAARDVDHAQLHEGGGAAARPDPGGKPRPDPRRRALRLPDGLPPLDVRDLVDQAGDHARARRPGPHDPAAGARRRPGAARVPGAAAARAEAQPRSRRPRRSRPRAASRRPASRSCSS